MSDLIIRESPLHFANFLSDTLYQFVCADYDVLLNQSIYVYVYTYFFHAQYLRRSRI